MILTSKAIRYAACRCASTSTSSPCHHAPPHRHSSSTSTSETRTFGPAFSYTAPLWERHWFKPSRTSSDRWIRLSRHPPPSLPPPLLPSPRRSKPSSPPVANPTDTLPLLGKYLSLRNSSHRFLGSLHHRRGPQTLLRAAKELDMPLVGRLVLEDLRDLREKGAEGWETGYRQTKEALDGPSEEPSGLEEDREKHETVTIVGKGLGELAGDATVDGKKKGKRERREATKELSRELLHWVDAREALVSVVESRSRFTPLPEAILQEEPELDTVGRLRKLWTTFTSSASLDSLEDFSLTLSFLHFLATPQSTPPHLPLALEVFQHLLDTSLSEESVAEAPIDSSLPRPVVVQTVLLRTIVSAALGDALYPLAITSLHSLDRLHTDHPALRTDETDLDLLESTLASLLSSLHTARQSTYRPTALSPSHPLLQSHSLLLSLLPHWSPASQDDSLEPIVGESTTELLEGFATEAAERGRWDLLGEVWELWGDGPKGRGWVMQGQRAKLLRWYGGDAPFGVYGAGEEREEGRRTTRTLRPREFAELAAATFGATGRGEGGVGEWTREEKQKWIELLCSSRAAGGRTRDLARRFYVLFAAQGTQRRSPFVLSGKALLALVRVSTPPVGNAEKFAATIVKHFIASITSPGSPYSSPSRIIEHYDLTTLAHCYALLGDPSSAAQVYRKLLDQKMLPDSTDVELILAAAARRRPTDAILYLRMAAGAGIVISREMLEGVILSTITHHRLQREEYGPAVQTVLRLADEFRLSKPDISQLRELGETMIDEQKPGKDVNVRQILGGDGEDVQLLALRATLRKAQRKGSWRSAITLYRAASKAGVLDEDALRTTLSTLVVWSRRSTPEEKDEINDACVDFIDHAISAPAPLLTKRSTFELALKCAVKMGDFGAIVELKERMDEGGVEPTMEVRDVVRRAAIALVGKEEVEKEGGWLLHVAKEN